MKTQPAFERVRGADGARVNSTEKTEGLWLVIVHVFKGYCETTVLHGVKYLGEPRRTIWERIAWGIILGCFVAIGVYVLWKSAEDSLSKPVIISLDTSYHPIWNYAFPAITLCPLNKLNKTLAKEWINSITLPPNVTGSELLHLLPNMLRLIDPAETEDLQFLQSVFDLNNTTVHAVYGQISVQCRDFLVSCKVASKRVNCKNLFRTIRTSEGYCCAYNYFGLRSAYHLSVYHVPSEDSPKEPVHMASSGKESGLSVLLRMPKSDNLATLMSSRGAKLLLHKPLNYPDHLTVQKLIQAGRAVSYSITPELINASAEIRSVPMNNRDCYFFDEMELFSASIYSYKNCIFNCRIDFYMKLCGCIPFTYPAKDVLQTLRDNLTEALGHDESAPCSCRPQCNDISYSVSTSSVRMVNEPAMFTDEFYDDITDIEQYAEVNMFFGSLFATKYQRLLYYSFYKLLANFGGLLGLFMGFSFIAALEIAYSLTLRVWFHLYLSHRQQRSKTALSQPVAYLSVYRSLQV